MQEEGLGYPLVRHCGASYSAPGTFSIGCDSKKGHRSLPCFWWWTGSTSISSPLMQRWLPVPASGPLWLQQAPFQPKRPVSSSMMSYLWMDKCQWALAPYVPLAACSLSAVGGFSRSTPDPLLVHIPALVHTVDIPAIS